MCPFSLLSTHPHPYVLNKDFRALERLVALAERRHQLRRQHGYDDADGVAYTLDPGTGRGLTMKELAVMLRCGHGFDFDGCFDGCALQILDLLEDTEGGCSAVQCSGWDGWLMQRRTGQELIDDCLSIHTPDDHQTRASLRTS